MVCRRDEPEQWDTFSDDRQRIERALTYIAAHIDRPLTLREVARAAYFHRVCEEVLGVKAVIERLTDARYATYGDDGAVDAAAR